MMDDKGLPASDDVPEEISAILQRCASIDYKAFVPGNKLPEEINAVVEIPAGQGRYKFEYRLPGEMVVDRVRGEDAPMYPVHYCGVPATQAPDGDPLDVLILGKDKWKTGEVVPVRVVALFWMSDEKGIDPKVIAVPDTDEYRHIQTLADVPAADRKAIEEFFGAYKVGDKAGKFSSSGGWEDTDVAHRTIYECIDRWQKVSAAITSAPARTPAPKP
jgi:inorganic pyrophosphatase